MPPYRAAARLWPRLGPPPPLRPKPRNGPRPPSPMSIPPLPPTPPLGPQPPMPQATPSWGPRSPPPARGNGLTTTAAAGVQTPSLPGGTSRVSESRGCRRPNSGPAPRPAPRRALTAQPRSTRTVAQEPSVGAAPTLSKLTSKPGAARARRATKTRTRAPASLPIQAKRAHPPPSAWFTHRLASVTPIASSPGAPHRAATRDAQEVSPAAESTNNSTRCS